MKKFMLFIAGLIALAVVLANIGPMILLGVSIWLLYIIFKSFVKTDSVIKKVGWVILGLIVLSISLSNIYAVVGLVAAFVLYWVYKEWKVKKNIEPQANDTDDPFVSFEKQWAELTK